MKPKIDEGAYFYQGLFFALVIESFVFVSIYLFIVSEGA